jgi:aspartyl protease family protein
VPQQGSPDASDPERALKREDTPEVADALESQRAPEDADAPGTADAVEGSSELQPAPAEEPDDGFPHIVTDSGSAEGSAAAATRRRTGDRTFRLALFISAAALVLLIVAVGAFSVLSPRSGPPSQAGARRASPDAQPAPVTPASPEPASSTLVLDWPPSERSGAVVSIDGLEQPVPASGEATFSVRPGEHEIVIKRRGYEPLKMRMAFEAGAHHHYQPQWSPVASSQMEPETASAEPRQPREPTSDADEPPVESVSATAEARGAAAEPTGPAGPSSPPEPSAEPESPSAEPKERSSQPQPPAPKPTPPADFGSPEELLAAKGLRRLSDRFALPEESEVSDKLRQAESLKRKAFNAQQEVAEAQKIVDEKKRLMLAYVQQSRELGMKLPLARNVEEHNRIVTMLNELEARILIMRESKQEEKALEQAQAAASALREEYSQHLLDLRRLYDEVRGRYEALAADGAIEEAIERYSQTASKTYQLGPTLPFLRMEGKLDRLEETVLTEAIELRRGAGNLWYVTAMFNGKVAQEMAIDTGASVIALPWEVAESVGLTPGDDDPAVLVEVADGRVVEARKVVARTVRVGKFTAENVECAVMPAGIPQTTPLLGLSFFRNFDFRIDSGQGTLIMSQIEMSEQ